MLHQQKKDAVYAKYNRYKINFTNDFVPFVFIKQQFD
jgi:hypothetical protein